MQILREVWGGVQPPWGVLDAGIVGVSVEGPGCRHHRGCGMRAPWGCWGAGAMEGACVGVRAPWGVWGVGAVGRSCGV